MEECIIKINKKTEENFQILALQNPNTKENTKNTEMQTHFKKRDRKENIRLFKDSKQESIKILKVKQQTPKTETSKHSHIKGKGKLNPFNIIENSSYYQLRARCATIPGENREEQLQNLVKIIQIPLESDLIQISCIGKSKLAILNFENPEDMWACRKELTDNLPSCDIFTCGIDSEWEHGLSDNSPSKITVKLTDIPNEFSPTRIKGAIKKYGKIEELKLIKGNNNFKSATVIFNEIKIDLEETWAIPMGENIARITPAENWENTLHQRNQITSRLYGINNSTPATKIMNAIKHLGAKTVYIPRNSKTNRRRSFAIIGFSSLDNLQKALATQVRISDLHTWWSTKDNQKLNDKRKKKYNTPTFNPSISQDNEESELEDNMSTTSTLSSKTSSNPSPSNEKMIKKYHTQKQKNRFTKNLGKSHTYIPSTENTLSSITSVLHDIAKRLDKLEEKGKRIRAPNRS